jgi:hypothetical protein
LKTTFQLRQHCCLFFEYFYHGFAYDYFNLDNNPLLQYIFLKILSS